MRRLKHKKGRALLFVILGVILLVFAASLGAVYYFGNQAIANQKSASEKHLAKMDKRIAEIKAKKEAERIAKEKAKKEAAKRKKEAQKALKSQMAGKVVTPKACIIKDVHGNPNAIDVVINKKRCFSPIDFVPGDLVSFHGYPISAKIKEPLAKLLAAGSKYGLCITSAYRSYSNQVVTYNNWVATNGSTAAADQVSARPGYSEHQTGFAVDLCSSSGSLGNFGKDGAYSWMKKNAYKYGFIQRYKAGYESITGYSAEPWHWRYVGVSVATDMMNRKIHTLEQYWNLPGGGY